MMKLSQGDAVLIRGKIVSVDANQATVSLSSTDFAIVPLGAIEQDWIFVPHRNPLDMLQKRLRKPPEKNVPRGGKGAR